MLQHPYKYKDFNHGLLMIGGCLMWYLNSNLWFILGTWLMIMAATFEAFRCHRYENGKGMIRVFILSAFLWIGLLVSDYSENQTENRIEYLVLGDHMLATSWIINSLVGLWILANIAEITISIINRTKKVS
ncbi:MAG: hypothetical protein ABJH98_18060 [Reichenbachiella sp.]|uniref:hypothetical protein n=1 Tax=Reichenbachiella sp. TaxID=2184521 RepID=UPI003299134E